MRMQAQGMVPGQRGGREGCGWREGGAERGAGGERGGGREDAVAGEQKAAWASVGVERSQAEGVAFCLVLWIRVWLWLWLE